MWMSCLGLPVRDGRGRERCTFFLYLAIMYGGMPWRLLGCDFWAKVSWLGVCGSVGFRIPVERGVYLSLLSGFFDMALLVMSARSVYIFSFNGMSFNRD